jgi:hypothetical protein
MIASCRRRRDGAIQNSSRGLVVCSSLRTIFRYAYYGELLPNTFTEAHAVPIER